MERGRKSTGRKKIDDGFKTPQARYDSQNTTRIAVKLNNRTDADLLEYLDKVPSKQGTIKQALRDYIARSTSKSDE